MSFATFFQVVLAVFFLLLSPTNSQSPCSLSLNRLILQKSYVYACDCTQSDGTFGPVGRAEESIPSIPADTAAQASATIRCILSDGARLLSICAANPGDFEPEASQTLLRCVEAPLEPEDEQLEGGFTFTRDNCKSSLAALVSSRVAGVWLCQCFQPQFDVIVGRAEFVTDGSPLGAEEELRLIERCSEGFEKEMNRICSESPADFNILAVHALQVCCRRARAQFDEEKFDCDRIVPDDVSPLKLSI